MIINIKGIRKWRITHDELSWVIQERIPNHQPPNDWKNRYWLSSLDSLITTLVDLNIDPSKLTDLRKASYHINTLKRNLLDAIQEIFDKTGGKIPETERIKSVRSSIKKKKK